MGTASLYQAGDGHIDYTPGSAVAVGDVVQLGDLFCIADRPIAANKLGALAIEGVFTLPKATGAVTQGATLYWDHVNSKITTAADDGGSPKVSFKRAGWAYAAQDSGDATVKVVINYG